MPGLLVLALAGAGTAEGQVSVEVSPLRVELQAQPGSSATQAVTLNNSGAEPLRVRARVTDWELSRDGSPQFESAREGGPFSASEWVRVAPPEQLLESGKEGIVRFSLAVPAGVPPGGYRTAVMFEFVPASAPPAARGREVQFRSRIATLIYVNIGSPPAAVELTDLRIRPEEDDTSIVAVLNNTGRRTVRTKGTMRLLDASGAPVREVPVPDVPLLPESEREVVIPATDASKPLPPGAYRVEVRFDLGMPELVVGETTLQVAK